MLAVAFNFIKGGIKYKNAIGPKTLKVRQERNYAFEGFGW